MVAAEHQRSEALPHRLRRGGGEVAADLGDGGEESDRGGDPRDRGPVGNAEVADVFDFMSQLAQAFSELRDPQVDGPMSTPRRLAPRSSGTPIMRILPTVAPPPVRR
jgi:hypothetical protein